MRNTSKTKVQILSFPDQILQAKDLGASIEIESKINHVVVAAVGGSASAAYLLKAVLHDKPIPISIIHDFTLPSWVNEHTLVFVVSYSGNTDETLEMCADAIRKKATIVNITSGGSLLELAKKRDKSYVKVPSGLFPRNAVAYPLLTMINVLVNTGLITHNKPDMFALANLLKNEAWEQKAEELAKKILNKIPLIYTSEKLKGVGIRFKQMLNENVKIHAFANTLPEQNHNEIEGFENLHARYQVVMIQDDDDHPKLKKRMLVTRKLIEKKGVGVTIIRLKGQSQLTKVLSAVHLVNLITYSLAELTNTDPAEIELIRQLKEMIV